MYEHGRFGLRIPISLFLALILIATTISLAPAAPLGQVPPEPEIGARAAIVVEYPSGRILYSRSAHDRLAPASTTKILTAILAIEYGKLQDVVTVNEADLVGESSMGLVSGEQQTFHELLYGLLLPSGNDAAEAIARSLGEKSTSGDPTLAQPVARFVAMMNARVTQLGLENSHFVNPHGLDMEGHYSSAYDLASLSWYALHLPVFNEVVSQFDHDSPGHALLNTNEMLTRYPGADGIKTGWTDAGGLCLVTSATRDGKRLISVVLNAPHWYTDSTVLLDYGFARLAAMPTDDRAEVLSVSKRGTAGWLLANGALIQPAPDAVPPGQGGGGVPPQIHDSQRAASPVDRGENKQAQPARLVTTIASRQENALPWAFLLFALVATSCCYLIASRLLRFRPARWTPRSQGVTSVSDNQTLALGQYGVRLLGENKVSRRREPNLLVTQTDTAVAHLEQALANASEGRQGASMSEFLSALRLGLQIDIAVLASQVELPSSAFLALARAQMTSGAPEEARATLLHGVLVFPNERLLRLALSQLR